jgi:hypothetical protein
MKVAVFFVIALLVFGYFFWGDIFGTDSSEGDVIVVDESLEESSLPADEDDGREGGDDAVAGGEGAAADVDSAAGAGGDEVAENPVPAQGAAPEPQSRPVAQTRWQEVLQELDRLESATEKRKLLGKVSADFDSLGPADVDMIVQTVAELNNSLPGSLSGLIRSENYTIRSGDNLWDICKDYNNRKKLNVEVGLVRTLNGLTGNDIFPGQTLKLPADKITIKVWKKSWLMCVFLGDTLLSAYKVGLGREGKTPGGLFVIESKLENPPWNSKKLGRIVPPGDPENILGTRWLGFKNTPQHQGYGIHGTEIPDSIGKNMSDGCIRLLNEDVEELFEVISRGTQVQII